MKEKHGRMVKARNRRENEKYLGATTYNRTELLRTDLPFCSNNVIPTLSKVRVSLGPTLTQAFFDYAHDDTRKLLNMKTPLISPKTCFPTDDKPYKEPFFPTDIEIMRAKVHESILEIGGNTLEKFQKQIEENVRETVERELQEKFFLYQAKKDVESHQITDDLHFKYENCIKIVQSDMLKQFQVEYAAAVEKCNKNTQKAVVQERMNVTQDMMQKMRIEMSFVVESLYKEFENMFRAEKENIIADFNGIMRKKHVKLKKEMYEFQKRLEQDLFIQKHKLEMQNAADIIYVLCLERLRSSNEKHFVHTYFQKQINGLKELIKRLNNVMTVMREEILNCHEEKKFLEEQLGKVAKQFQKYIDFVFYAVPGQADYLLPQKLLKYIPADDDKKENSK